MRLTDQLSKPSADEIQKLMVGSTSGDLSLLYLTGSGAQAPRDPRSTAFGGIFLILPHLDELPLVEATRDWPHADEAAAISLVRFLVLLKCCGRGNSERAFYDPLLRDLLLIPPTLSPEALRTWQSRLKPEHLQNFLGDSNRMAMVPRCDRRKRTAAHPQQASWSSIRGLNRRRSRALVARR